jgi:hypothetical protein
MLTKDFAAELAALDSRLTVIPNRNMPGLANVKLDGFDVCPVPADEIFDEARADYRYTFPNGYCVPHKGRHDVLALVHKVLKMAESEEGMGELRATE